MDRLTSMAVFIQVVEKGSFVLAAAEMNISPTMVGKHIRFLESRLQARLLARTTRQQGVTEIGRLFYERCRRLLADAEQAEALTHHLLTEPAGKLRISAPVVFGNHVLTPLLTGFMQSHQEITIEVVLSDRKVDLIDEHFDAVFRIGDIGSDGVIARRLPDYTLVLAASPDYLARYGAPARPADLSGHNCFGFSQWQGNSRWRLTGPGGEDSVEVHPRLRIDSGESVRQAALAGFGIAMHAEILLGNDIAAGRLVQVLPNWRAIPRPMHVISLPDRQQPLKLELFIASLVAALWGRTPANPAAAGMESRPGYP
ncbi:LysR family transcriptional regulator [Sodalis sp. C49]|uniref:LysR family transcriptional regulator n=1 Tax=Sodalis sp. C49 TaxID=3228929 RepID=UPI003965CAFE